MCRLLAVGSQIGEVLFYMSGPDNSGSSGGCYQLSQKLRCGGSAITCAAWMTHNRSCVPLDSSPVSLYYKSLTTHAWFVELFAFALHIISLTTYAYT